MVKSHLVAEHYQVSDRWIGLLSASIFAGMMVRPCFLYFNPLLTPQCRSAPGAGAAVRPSANSTRPPLTRV